MKHRQGWKRGKSTARSLITRPEVSDLILFLLSLSSLALASCNQFFFYSLHHVFLPYLLTQSFNFDCHLQSILLLFKQLLSLRSFLFSGSKRLAALYLSYNGNHMRKLFLWTFATVRAFAVSALVCLGQCLRIIRGIALGHAMFWPFAEHAIMANRTDG